MLKCEQKALRIFLMDYLEKQIQESRRQLIQFDLEMELGHTVENGKVVKGMELKRVEELEAVYEDLKFSTH